MAEGKRLTGPQRKENLPLWTLGILIFPCVNILSFWDYNMFLDGLTYGAIARNWADGEGAIWSLHYSKYLYDTFYEHPPLFFISEGALFYIFGDHSWIEEVFGLMVWSGYVYLVGRVTPKGMIPMVMLLLLFLPRVFWGFQNNMLDPYAFLWILASILFYEGRIHKKQDNGSSLVAGLCAVLALFTKGLAVLPIVCWPFLRSMEDRKWTWRPILFIVPIVVLVVVSCGVPAIFAFWKEYYRQQVLESGSQGWGSLYSLVKRLIDFGMGAVVLVTFVFVLRRFKVGVWVWPQKSKSWIIMAMMFALPWLVFHKYHPHYTFGFNVLIWAWFVQGLKVYSPYKSIASVVVTLVFCLIIGLVMHPKKRQAILLCETAQVRKGSEVKVSSQLCEDWYLYAAFQRIQQVDIQCTDEGDINIYHQGEKVKCGSVKTIHQYQLCEPL